ncbi:precorrin-8X methylmutase [Larsenimonas salina]|uniref:precorrin-8X methylmutase n=1 Tax=Larsenimonas salina TaxID=1295565 RepID=UPI0020741C02|nr:precorrin-8X methylmutase [Larsenimonas salina]MCM5703649.1 precorrin-8X methylmutase [Larsenimonas salina]
MIDWPEFERDPRAIERESFRQIRALTDLSRFNDDEAQVAMRLVHTCGDPAMASSVRLSADAVTRGLEALSRRAPVLCDVEMVRFGLTQRYMDALGLEAHCFLRRDSTGERARAHGMTRTMAAVADWLEHLEGSIVLIGNAPTALFHLLEKLRDGAPRPALIIAMPVGFVGAAESKAHLWAAQDALDLKAMTLLGRQGGSALTAAAFNALLRIHQGERY